VFSQLDLARDLLDYEDNEFSGIEIALNNKANIAEIQEQIKAIFEQKVEVKTRLQLNDELYKMLNTENLMVYLISTLVLVIALFNLVGAVIMAILDKRENIKTLSNLGASKTQINTIFFFQGLLTTIVGSVVGIVIGVVIILLQLQFEMVNITATLPYPVKFSFVTVLIVFTTTIVLGVLASKIASSRAGKLA
jgi:lipoprotein-releasing system permease protein